MAARLSEIIAVMEALAPPELAAEWDNVGLMLGTPEAEVRRILVCLDVTMAVAAEAAARGPTSSSATIPFFPARKVLTLR